MKLNFWVLALFYKWATTSMVKQAMTFNDCTVDELEEGVVAEYVTPEQFFDITGLEYQ
ncbi:XkdX family protein [Bacillus safensis]|uniref:XkdX family protein n=1 Tax=Bacillus safensis TaxID=561879 RepID=UPI003C243BCB